MRQKEQLQLSNEYILGYCQMIHVHIHSTQLCKLVKYKILTQALQNKNGCHMENPQGNIQIIYRYMHST